MILDSQALFSDSQAITVTANSSNVIDNLATSTVPGTPGSPISVFAQVMQAFSGGTSLQISVVSADDAALTTNAVTHFTTAVIPVASLTAGLFALATRLPPQKMRKYLGLKYTVVGTMSAGTILAAVVDDLQTVRGAVDYSKGFTVA
jgi:hypothetical protein